jgi:hypothetical protein
MVLFRFLHRLIQSFWANLVLWSNENQIEDEFYFVFGLIYG